MIEQEGSKRSRGRRFVLTCIVLTGNGSRVYADALAEGEEDVRGTAAAVSRQKRASARSRPCNPADNGCASAMAAISCWYTSVRVSSVPIPAYLLHRRSSHQNRCCRS